MSKPAVYLAGPVMHPEDGGHGWRDHLTAEYADRAEWVNPLDKYDGHATDVRIGEDITVPELVEADKQMIDECDAVLVGWSRVPSVGTPMEVIYAHDREMPVAVWFEPDEGGTPVPGKTLSPWMAYHADHISASITDCLQFLEGDVP